MAYDLQYAAPATRNIQCVCVCWRKLYASVFSNTTTHTLGSCVENCVGVELASGLNDLTHISCVELIVTNDLCTFKHVLARAKSNTKFVLQGWNRQAATACNPLPSTHRHRHKQGAVHHLLHLPPHLRVHTLFTCSLQGLHRNSLAC